MAGPTSGVTITRPINISPLALLFALALALAFALAGALPRLGSVLARSEGVIWDVLRVTTPVVLPVGIVGVPWVGLIASLALVALGVWGAPEMAMPLSVVP